MFAISTSEAVVTDPNTLKLGSDRVVFIKDPASDGTLAGDGSGSDADNPLSVIDVVAIVAVVVLVLLLNKKKSPKEEDRK